MPEKGYSQRTKIRDKGSFPKVPDCHGYNSYIGVDPPGSYLQRVQLFLTPRTLIECQNEDKDPKIINNQTVMKNI